VASCAPRRRAAGPVWRASCGGGAEPGLNGGARGVAPPSSFNRPLASATLAPEPPRRPAEHVFDRPDVLEVYRRHPLREERILERVRDQRGSLDGIDELDLARDRDRGITDQNHVGGLSFVKALARRAGVAPGTRVLDLGCGLGGSARVLAHLHGCLVTGLDLSADRCREAASLTRRVGLAGRVRFVRADFARAVFAPGAFDLIWGQGAWGHVRDKEGFLGRWAEVLAAPGRIAFEESCLLGSAADLATRRRIAELEDHWKCYLVHREEWLRLAAAVGRIESVEDLGERFARTFARLLRRAERAGGAAPAAGRDRAEPAEREGWRCARALTRAGVLGYVRIVVRTGA